MNKQQYIHTTINHIYHNILQYMHKVNIWVFALFVLLLPALSFALPEQQVPLDEDNLDAKHTIWVAGDYRIVARAFRVSAAIFGDGGMVGLMKIAALFALVAMAMSVISKRNGQIMSHIILFVLMACAFNIKTPVIVASYFDGVSGGGVIGAVKHEKIDNVPIGVAWPLVIFSNIAKKLSADYDEQMQVLPDDGRLAFKPSEEGGILVHGTEGYFSPLKAILRLRHTASVGPEDELIFTNFYQNMEDCNWSKRISRYADEVGILRTLASNGQSGARVVLYYKDDNGNKKQKYTNCDAVGKYIALLMKENTLSRGNGKHSVKGEKASESGLKGVMGAFFDNRYDSKQREVDMLPNLLASGFKNSSTISRDNNTALKEIEQAKKAVIAIEWGDDRTQAPANFPVGLANDLWKLDSVNAAMQTNLVSNRVAADEIEASIIYNHVLSECSTLNANDCNRYIMAMTSARNKAAIDSAGMASMFQHYIHYAMNILIFVYVVMSPIIMVVILAKGLAGWKLAGAYLLFAVWANSWLPLDAAIAYYMQQSYIDRMSDLITALEVSNQTHRIYSLGTLNAVLDGAQDTIASASNFMAMVPIIMLSLLSGSIYGLVQVAQRAGMTGRDYVEEGKIAADLETSQVTGAARLLNEQAARSSTGYVSNENPAMLLRASTLASTDKVAISQSEIASHQAQEIIGRAQTMAESIGTTETRAIIDSEGVATKSGWVLTHSNETGLKAEYMEKGDSISKFTDENKNVVAVTDSSSFGKEAHAGVEGHVSTEGELGFKVFGNGATTKIGASANAGTSASHSTDHTEKTDRSSSISSANSSSFGVSDSKATFAGEGRSFNDMTGLEIGNNHISQAQISQALSQARTDTINKAASEAESYQSSHSQGYSVEFMAKDIIKDIHTNTPDNIARQEFAQAAEIAGRFSSKAYETLKDIPLSERAADDFGNGVLSLMSSNNMSEKMAGVAALYVATEDIGTAEGQRLHAQLGHLLDTYGTGDRVREIQASINAPLDAQSVDVGT
ncbi:MAG: conjugal transfer protein TraG N-terminal domain-containing protein, partial [Neisseriaceae bacterium]|nr:conjugal transfer protein TraG N-terminal domain-containing protein [Neisseriaceae bacterium]